MKAIGYARLGGALMAIGCSGAPSTPPPPAAIPPASPPVIATATPSASASPAGVKDCAQTDPVEECKWACGQGSLPSCVRFGLLRDQSDPKEAAIFFEKACNGGEQSGCDNLGVLYHGGALERDYPRAAALYTKACDSGYAPACGHLADLRFRSEPGIEAQTDEEFDAAVKLLERACDGNDARSCGVLGTVHYTPIHVPENQAKGCELLAKGCAMGSEWACKWAAEMWQTAKLANLGNIKEHERSARVTEFAKRQKQLREAACEDTGQFCNLLAGVHASTARARLGELCHTRHNIASCNDLGLMLEEGEQGDRDFEGAAGLFEIACDGGAAASCYELARFHKFGHAVGKNIGRTFALTQRSCALGFPQGCDVLGTMYLDGEGTDRDLQKSLAFRRKACGWHDGNACRALGIWLISHAGVEVPEEESLREGAARLRLACNEQTRPACLDYNVLIEKGWGVPKDPKKAREDAKVFCDHGYTEACDWLKNPALHTPQWIKEREQQVAKRKARGAGTKEPR